MSPSDIIATTAAVISLASLVVSWMAYRTTHSDTERGGRRGRSESAMELFELWDGMHLIGRSKPVTTHVVKAHRALAETARRWLDNAEERPMIFRNFGADYIAQYEACRDCKVEAPGLGVIVASLLTHDMGFAYGQMNIYKE